MNVLDYLERRIKEERSAVNKQIKALNSLSRTARTRLIRLEAVLEILKEERKER